MPYKKGQKWIGQIRKNGKKRIQKRFPTKQAALSWEVEEKKKPTSDPGLKTPTEYSLGEWANEYLWFAEAKFSSVTFSEKGLVFRLLFQKVDPNLPAGGLVLGKALNHLQEQAKKRSGHAANKDRKNLIAAWNWGKKYIENFPTLNPCLVEKFPEVRTPDMSLRKGIFGR